MHKCGICGQKSPEVFSVDDYLVCDACLVQGRLDEIPEIERAGRHELQLVGAGAMRSSWWNREVPERISSIP